MEKRRENIAIIVQHLYGGGAERVAADLSIALSKKRNVFIVTFNSIEKQYEYEGKLLNINLPTQSNIFNKVINAIKRVVRLRDIKKEFNIDCSISLLNNANIVNVLSKRKEKVIVSVHSLMSVSSNNYIKRLIIKIIIRLSDKTVAVSNMSKNDLVQNFNIDINKVTTIYNSCNVNKLLSKEPSYLFDEILRNNNHTYITTVGRLENPKGHWHLIKAFKCVHDKLPSARLIIVGEGALREKLSQLASILGLSDVITFMGFVTNSIEIIQASDLFVFSSIYEGFGNVILEAMACGKSIISTDCDAGPREILAPNTPVNKKTDQIEYADYGVLVPSFGLKTEFSLDSNISTQESIMGDAIYELLTNNNLRKKYEKCSSIRVKDFLPEIIVEQWDELIDTI